MKVTVFSFKPANYLRVLAILLAVLVQQTSFAYHQAISRRLVSGPSNLWYYTPGTTASNVAALADNNWYLDAILGSSTTWSNDYKYYNIYDKVIFGIDNVNPICGLPDYDAKIIIKVDYINQTNTATPTETIELWVKYRQNGGNQLQLLDVYTNTGGYLYQQVTIDAIDIYQPGTTTPFSTPFWPENLYVDNIIEYDRYVDMVGLNTSTLFPGTYGNTGTGFNSDFGFKQMTGIYDRVVLDWEPVFGAEEYMLEWTWVSDPNTSSSSSSLISPSSFTYNFTDNASRVIVKNTKFEIPIIYEKGYIVARVKPLGRDIDDPSIVTELGWNNDGFGPVNTMDNYTSLSTSTWGGKYYYYVDGFENKLNWQHSITFAEEGKTKQLISYFDGTLRKRQSVTRVNSTDSVSIVGETIYDSQGRPAVEVLPVPVQTNSPQSDKGNKQLTYQNQFNHPVGDVTHPYSYKNFDEVGSSDCVPVTDGMDTQTGSSQYYSTDNLDATGDNKLVPDAENYPFVQTEYTPDNTGRINTKSGAGDAHKIGSGHETKFFYATPLPEQLFRLFGNEVGFNVHYQKEAVIDANGSISVTYKDAAGKVIATSMAGDPSATPNLVPLDNSSFSQTINADLLSTNKYDTINTDWKIVATTNHFVATEGDHFFAYELDREVLTDECLPDLCYSCVYDLNITITDACGVSMIPGYASGITQTVGTVDTVCGGELHFELTPDHLQISLDIGTYVITKTLTINTDAVDAYWDLYVQQNTCIKTLDDFEDDFLADVDFSLCVTDCDACRDKLGVYADHNDENKANPEHETYDPNYIYLTQAQFDLMVENCDELCDDGSEDLNCDIYTSMLEADVTPGGQYAPYTTGTTGNYIIDTANQYSIFHSGGYVPYYQSITYHIDGNPANDEIDVLLNDGTTKHVNELTPEEFDEYFDDSWLPSLITLHPENCRKNFICDNVSSALDYSNAMNNISSAQDALAQGYYNPTNNSSIPAPYNGTSLEDPFFTAYPAQKAVLDGILMAIDHDNDAGTATINAWQFASLGASPGSDNHWAIFKALYIKYKNQIIEDLMITACPDADLFEPGGDFNDDIRQRIFFNSADAYTAGGVSGADGVDWDNHEDVEDFVSGQQMDSYTTLCEGSADVIIAQLKYCITETNELDPTEQATLDTRLAGLKTELIDICVAGYDPANPVPVSISSEGSFINSISNFFTQHSYVKTTDCNEMTVTLPKPPGYGTGTMQPLDDCACNRLATLQTDYQALVIAEDLPAGVVTITDYAKHIYGYPLNVTMLLRKCKEIDALTPIINPIRPTIRADYKEIANLYVAYKDSLSISETTPWQNLDFAAFSNYVNTHSVIHNNTTTVTVRDLLKTSIENTTPYAVIPNVNNNNGIFNLLDTLVSIGGIKDTIIYDWGTASAMKLLPQRDGNTPHIIEINISRPDSVLQINRDRYTIQVSYPKMIHDTTSKYYRVQLTVIKNTVDTSSYNDTLAFGIKQISGVLCGPTPADSVGQYFYLPSGDSASLSYIFEPESCYGDSITFRIYERSDSIAADTYVSIPIYVNPYMGDGFDITVSGATLIQRLGAYRSSFRTVSKEFLDLTRITSLVSYDINKNYLASGAGLTYSVEIDSNPANIIDFDLTTGYQQLDNAYTTPYRPDPGTGSYCDNTDLAKAPFILNELISRSYNSEFMPVDALVRDTLVNLFNTEFSLTESWPYYERLINEIYDDYSNTDCYENQQLGTIALAFLNGILADGAFLSPSTTNLTGESYINNTLYPNINQPGFQGLYWSSFGSHDGPDQTPAGHFVAYLTDRSGYACKTIEINAPNSFHFWDLVTGFSNIRPASTTASTNQFLIDITFDGGGTPVTITFNGFFGCGLTYVDCYTEGPKVENVLVPAELTCSDCITCSEAYDVMNWVYKQIRPGQHEDIDLIESLLRNWAYYKDYPTYHYISAQNLLYAYQQCNQNVECDTLSFPAEAGLIKYAILNFAQDGRLENSNVFPLSLYPAITAGLGFAPSDTAYFHPTATIFKRSNAIGVTNIQIILDDRYGALAEPEPVINFSYPTEYSPANFTNLSLRSILPSKDGLSTLFKGIMYVSDTIKFEFHGGLNAPIVTCTYPDTMLICPNDLAINIPNDSLECVQDLINTALTNAFNSYQDYLDSLNVEFTMQYKRKCIKATELWEMEYTDKEYHFTLYYYDRAGNLIKTVPPQGVVLLDQPAIDDATDFNNNVPGSSRVFTTHTYNTNYQMNSLNQVLTQKTPDAEHVDLYYDRLGRVLLSQSGRQRQGSQNNYSYTLYDKLGRITETGEITGVDPDALLSASGLVTGYNTFIYYDEDPGDDFVSFVAAHTRRQVTHTTYDVPRVAITGFEQNNLRNRVSSITISDTYVDLLPPSTGSGDPDGDGVPDQYDYATHYTYDVSGNVDRVVQEYPGLAILGKRYFTIDYDYDLISGKVNSVTYQKNQQDQFIHRYKYDADNRITTVRTSRDGSVFYNNASYDYYLHGPLKRVELGNGEGNGDEDPGTFISWPVQGLDYAYTLQGWIKGMNSDQLDPTKDMGEDGATGSMFPKDAFGYTVGYFDGDYTPIGGSGVDFNTATTGMTTAGLYNGNISRVTNALMKTDNTLMDIQGNAYKYDQLNRLKEKDAYILTPGTGYAADGNTNFKEKYTYDANGNILSLIRHASSTISPQVEMDSLNYTYQANTNKLVHVDDNVAFDAYQSGDIDDQTATTNYEYDDDGNLTKDVAEEIDNIEWNVYGKIRTITRISTSLKADLEFCYGPDGNRLLKIVKPRDGSGVKPASYWTVTYYVRDAQGNIMCTYNVNKEDDDWVMKADEFVMYGSSRLGVVKDLADASFTGGNMPVAYPSTNMDTEDFIADQELAEVPIDLAFAVLKPYQLNYELTNFRGDVQSVVSADSKTNCVDGPDTDPEPPAEPTLDQFVAYLPQIQSVQDYYSFGSLIQARTQAPEDYRFGFNGQDRDHEIAGTGNINTAEYWEYDTRLGRRWNTDPITYPWQSPYACFNNNPIYYIDPFGLEGTGPEDPKSKSKSYQLPTVEITAEYNGPTFDLKVEKHYKKPSLWQDFKGWLAGVERSLRGDAYWTFGIEYKTTDGQWNGQNANPVKRKNFNNIITIYNWDEASDLLDLLGVSGHSPDMTKETFEIRRPAWGKDFNKMRQLDAGNGKNTPHLAGKKFQLLKKKIDSINENIALQRRLPNTKADAKDQIGTFNVNGSSEPIIKLVKVTYDINERDVTVGIPSRKGGQGYQVAPGDTIYINKFYINTQTGYKWNTTENFIKR